ncbi:mucin-12-like [Penaeus monodon]|uniref:mucin-12-like n=1 Tax=Penaeus monodon TaxID=6687 RepID=UPI0018A6F6D7|nr:mucin-12-like [Penaeus monodon]
MRRLLLLGVILLLQEGKGAQATDAPPDSPMCLLNMMEWTVNMPSDVKTEYGAVYGNNMIAGCQGSKVILTCKDTQYFHFSKIHRPQREVTLHCALGGWHLHYPKPRNVGLYKNEPGVYGCAEDFTCSASWKFESDLLVTSEPNVTVSLWKEELDPGEHVTAVREGTELGLKGTRPSKVHITCLDPRALIWLSTGPTNAVTFDCNGLKGWSWIYPLCYPACKTKSGQACRLPFVYKDTEYHSCTRLSLRKEPQALATFRCGLVYNVTDPADLHVCDMNKETSTCGRHIDSTRPQSIRCGGGPECLLRLHIPDASALNITPFRSHFSPRINASGEEMFVQGCIYEHLHFECANSEASLQLSTQSESYSSRIRSSTFVMACLYRNSKWKFRFSPHSLSPLLTYTARCVGPATNGPAANATGGTRISTAPGGGTSAVSTTTSSGLSTTRRTSPATASTSIRSSFTTTFGTTSVPLTTAAAETTTTIETTTTSATTTDPTTTTASATTTTPDTTTASTTTTIPDTTTASTTPDTTTASTTTTTPETSTTSEQVNGMYVKRRTFIVHKYPHVPKHVPLHTHTHTNKLMKTHTQKYTSTSHTYRQ